MDKSHVSMEQHACLVCGKPFDTGTILLDTRVINGKLRQSLEPHTVTGWGLCPEDEKLYKDGYIALVACDESRSTKEPDGSVGPSGAWRTGAVAHVRFTLAERLFTGVSLKTEAGKPRPILFCDEQVILKLQGMMAQDTEMQALAAKRREQEVKS